jgi:AcrR family transcriptional regulator
MTSEDRRTQLIDRIADHLLEHGLSGASLRPMAAAAGTSDRMLLYYFPDREAVLTAALELVAAQMASGLEAAVPGGPLPFADLLRRLRTATRTPAFGRYMQLWLEVAARAARDEPPYRVIGETIGRGFLAWAAARLEVTHEGEKEARAALLLATLDGLALLDSVGLSIEADASAAAL